MRSRGIILKKHFPHRLRVSVLDEHVGHVTLIPDQWHWASYACVGAVIQYELPEEQGRYFIQHVELLAVPSYETVFAQLFLHHVIELCYFFLPVGSGASECFALLIYVLAHFDQITRAYAYQRLFVAKLLYSIGMYPADAAQLSISSSLAQSYDTLIQMGWTDKQLNEYSLFIYQCIQNHPHGRLLKTINFLSRVDR